MTSRQNSFRLGRLSRTSDLRKHSISQYNQNPKDTLKLAALTSINQGVKYNDLSFITGRELPKLRKQPQQGTENFQYGAAHQNLTTIRRKFDNINKQKLQVDSKIVMLKEQREKYKTVEDQYLSNKNQGNNKVSSMEENLNTMKLQLQQTEWNKKILQMMAERIRHDKIVYDQRKFNLEKQLTHLKKQQVIFVKQGTEINEETDRTGKVYEKLMKQLQNEEIERESHLESLSSMLTGRMSVTQSNAMRKNEIEQIALKAMQDKDENEKNWVSIFHVNKLVDCMLRNKMYREMQKFSIVQLAFKNIKIATGVSDAQELIYKFLNKEQAYGELLGKIADNQRRITELKNQNEALLKERKSLKEDRQQYFYVKKGDVNFHDGQLKELEEVSKKELHVELNSERIRGWILKNLKKVYNIEKIQEDPNLEKSSTSFATVFKKYLEVMAQQVNKCENIDVKQEKVVFSEVSPNSKEFRVKPKTKRLSNSGEENEHEFEEQEIQNLNEEQDVIVNQRAEILKYNERFMKDLKKKMDEKKKLIMEAEPKKKAMASPEKKHGNADQ